MKLILFLADLLRNQEVQAAFVRDPQGVMTRAGLSHAERDAFQSRDRHRLADAVGKEIRDYLPLALMPWPDRRPEINAITPSTGQRGSTVPTLVTGSFASQEMAQRLAAHTQPVLTATLIQGATQIHGGPISDFKVTESSWSLHVSFALPANCPTGSYSLQLEYQGSILAVKPQAFNVT